VLSLLSPAAFTWCPAAGRYALKLKEKQRNLARSGFFGGIPLLSCGKG